MSDFDGTGQSLTQNYGSSSDSGDDSNSFGDSWSTGFGTGLNLTSGVFGIFGSYLQNQITDDELSADEAQINLSLQQNKLAFTQKISATNMKMATVLSGVRTAAASSGTTAGAGNWSNTLERNLSGYDQDTLSNFANYTYENQKLEEKRAADEQKASDEEDSSWFSGITSFFK